MFSPPRHSPSTGFTLTEVLVVLAIVGIVLGLSAWTLSTYLPYSNLKRAARTMTSLCQLARQEAIKRNTRVALVCNNATGTASVYLTPGADGNWTAEADNVLFRRFLLQELPGQVRFGLGSAAASPANTTTFFVFNARGGISQPAPPRSITLQDAAGHAMALTVRSISGSIIVQQWDGNTWTPATP